MNEEWSEKQIWCVMKAASVADGGCADCIRAILLEFLHVADFGLISVMDKIAGENTKMFPNCQWGEVRPDTDVN